MQLQKIPRPPNDTTPDAFIIAICTQLRDIVKSYVEATPEYNQLGQDNKKTYAEFESHVLDTAPSFAPLSCYEDVSQSTSSLTRRSSQAATQPILLTDVKTVIDRYVFV